MKILTLVSIAFLSFSVTANHDGGVMVTPEVYGVKLIEIDFCQNASCKNAIKVGGGKRINRIWVYAVFASNGAFFRSTSVPP